MSRFTWVYLDSQSPSSASPTPFSTNRRAIRWRTVAWGLGLQILFASPRHPLGASAAAHPSTASFCGHHQTPRPLLQTAARLVFGRIGTLATPSPLSPSPSSPPSSSSAHSSPSCTTSASCSTSSASSPGSCNAPWAPAEPNPPLQRRRQHLHGPDRSPAHHSTLRRVNAFALFRAHDHHDLRHGTRLRRNHGRLHRIRHPRLRPPRRRHHDRNR